MSTTVWVKDGQTVTIGGLFNSSDAKSGTKVPFLGDVPMLGNLLFNGKRLENVQTELIIQVIPKIISSTTTGNIGN